MGVRSFSNLFRFTKNYAEMYTADVEREASDETKSFKDKMHIVR